MKTTKTLQDDISASEEVRPLVLLQQAAANEHEDISENASVRLEALGATGTARSIVSGDGYSATEEGSSQNSLANNDAVKRDVAEELHPEIDELEKRLNKAQLLVQKKNEGALTCYLIGPDAYSARVTSSVWWDGREQTNISLSFWNDMDDRTKGFVTMFHASFGAFIQLFTTQ